MKNFCVNCRKEIKKKDDDYFKVGRYEKGKLVCNDYAHIKCHEKVNEINNKAMENVSGMMNMAKSLMSNLGIEQKKEVEIVAL